MMTDSLTIYHSPDADDAFMFYGLTCGAVTVPGFEIRHELSDIETLNQRALRGELDVTAISVHAYADLADQYEILDCGASMGEKDYGPKLICRSSQSLKEVRRIAIPGQYTSACLVLKLFLRHQALEKELVIIPFDEIQQAVERGQVDAGVIIHEGQLTFEERGFQLLADLGQWWWRENSLPLPLGINVIKRSLSEKAKQAAATALFESIQYSLAHREKALDYALTYGRGISREVADTFVGMYVNDRTLSLGTDGRKAIESFLRQGAESDMIKAVERFDFVIPQPLHPS
ncbi:MAG: hypothetical protein KDD64_07770 [Bdellovibrionales bacterium]|nr:hypothetical protein [Bdellovibrionales bacterium]